MASEHGSIRLPTWSGLLVWAIVGTAAYALVGFLFHFPSGFPPNNGADLNLPAFVVGLVQGVLSGLVVGATQAALLRSWFTDLRRWIAAHVAGLALIHAIGDALPDPIALPVVQITGGLILAMMVWGVLRWSGSNGVVWVLAVAGAWSIGLTLGLGLMARTTLGWAGGHVLAGATTGLFVSGAMGVLWLRSARQSPGAVRTASQRQRA